MKIAAITDTNVIIHIPTSRFGGFVKKITAMAKKANKWGVTPTRYLDLGLYPVEVVERHENCSVPRMVECHRVQIFNEIPRINGWTLAAKLDDRDGDGVPVPTLIKDMQSDELLALIEHADLKTCEHCSTRRRRKLSYILQNESGEYKQVGSTCLQDFLGETNVRAFDLWFGDELTAEDINYLSGESYSNDFTFPLENIIAETISEIELTGQYVSAAVASENQDLMMYGEPYNTNGLVSTGNAVSANIYGIGLSKRTSAHQEKAKVIRAWFMDFMKTPRYDAHNEWMFKLGQIFSKKETSSQIGLVASLVSLYNRETKVVTENNSVFVGLISDRLVFTLTLLRKTERTTEWGTSTIFFAEDANGNHINMTTTTCIDWNVGETKSYKATVKSHEDHPKFGKSTWVFRAKEVRS